METYESIKVWKIINSALCRKDSTSLNHFHDQVMKKILEVAKSKMKDQLPPCDFSWFITGSGGRFEQGIISDQDHGIVYEISNLENDRYFKELGQEISYGMDFVGYPFCNGGIMSSNPIWCKSKTAWKKQLKQWMEDASWQSIRYLQIFYDARVLYGNRHNIDDLKSFIYQFQLDHHSFIQRFVSNMKLIRNVIGPMGQIIVEQHGVYQGCINLKYTAFLPYVNSIRLLSIKEGILQTSTIDRIAQLQQLEEYKEILLSCAENFSKLLEYRMTLCEIQNYDDTHYLNIKQLTKDERKEIKQILKVGRRLHDGVIGKILMK